MVLAAGPGRRLRPWTDTLPKALLPVDGDRTILDISLSNFKKVGLEDVVVVTGYAAGRIAERRAQLESRHAIRLELIFNDMAAEWNNAYSLWSARKFFRHGVLLINGDTIAPARAMQSLLDADGDHEIVIALDEEKPLGEEEMKVCVSEGRLLTAISKQTCAADADGEYIGLMLIRPIAAERLAKALQATFERNPDLYYEDGLLEFAARGGRVGVAPIRGLEWVEVDDCADLVRAREVACRC
jgi:choline kinase